MPGKIGRLVAVLLVAASAARAQSRQGPPDFGDMNLAVTANGERAQVAPSGCCFWMAGLGVDFGVSLWHGVGVAAELLENPSVNIAPGVNLGKIDYFAGPRYTRPLRPFAWSQHPVDIFGQTLFGGVHAYDTVIPAAGKIETSANAFAMEAGGGVDLRLLPRLGLRLIQADYLYSQIPNGASGTQNNFRIGAGLLLHFR